jgi:hypothetical protein
VDEITDDEIDAAFARLQATPNSYPNPPNPNPNPNPSPNPNPEPEP